jgi:hypothetical protein
MNAAELGVLLPIIIVTLSLGYAIVSTVMRSRERVAALEHRHKERLAAIEKGIELPPELPLVDEDASGPKKASRFLLRGLVCLGIGIAIAFSALTVMPEELLLPASILIAIGTALTIYYFVVARRDEPGAAPPDSGRA